MKKCCVLLLAVALVATMAIPVYAVSYTFTDMWVMCMKWYEGIAADYPYYAVYWAPDRGSQYFMLIASPTPVIYQGTQCRIRTYRSDSTVELGGLGTYDYMQCYTTLTPRYAVPRWSDKPATSSYGDVQYYVTNLSTAKPYDHNTTIAAIPNHERVVNVSLPSSVALQNAINAAEQITNIGYTPESWALFQ